ncbi:Protein involved in meiotic recombination/predicted coiled-coil protein [Phaffia rhodozyma]|uniref:Protein involved in meiotic recombination/predicted coiled-coil protein n=1 Tax=Phaffia rhodozyma TaxID=264483 RepID=A0A0F7SX57_PHARH|nr:Protein involved in meiotic recombination/predicted coiled-coil protein [Phaffia rhodozyma]
MSKRGLSAAEKRVKMLELLHEEKQFFQLKELERLAPARKGIVSQSVKDVLQELMDDGHVDYDKIGTSNCKSYTHFDIFWSFQSAAIGLRDQSTEYREKASVYGQADPQVYRDKVSAGEIARREACRHTENVLILFDWMRRTFDCKEDALRSMFEIEPDWEQGYS